MNIECRQIKNERDYELIMAEILDLMNKGESYLSSEESEKIRPMALASPAYEKEHYYVKPPSSFRIQTL